MDVLGELLTDQLLEIALILMIAAIGYAGKQIKPLAVSGAKYLVDVGLIQKGDDLNHAIDNAVWAIEEVAARTGIAGDSAEKFRRVKTQARRYANRHGLHVTDEDMNRMIEASVRELKAMGGELKAAVEETVEEEAA